MNICLVSQEYPPETGGGGIGTQVFLKAHAFVRLGHTVHVISSTYDVPARTYEDGGVIVHRIAHPVCETPFSEESLHWVGYSWAVAKKLYELSDEVTFDLIEFPEYGAEGFIYQLDAHRYHHIPIVVSIYGSLTMFAERTGWPAPDTDFRRFGTFMEETVVRGADLLFAASRNAAAFWADRCSISLENIQVNHTAVDPIMFPPIPTKKTGRPTVLFVGRIDEAKGAFTLAKAVLRLKQKYPDILFRIIGSGKKRKLLQEMIEASRAWQNFEFLGHVPYDELAPYYAGCDVFASPAPQEHGLATVYLEALSCGRPVVACNTGGAPEAVIDGETGLLVSPGDVEGLAQALDKLLANPEMRDRLGKKGRETVLAHFAIDRHVRRAEEAYDKLLARWKADDCCVETGSELEES